MDLVQMSERTAKRVEGKLNDIYATVQYVIMGNCPLDFNKEYVLKDLKVLEMFLDGTLEKGKVNKNTYGAMKVRIMAVTKLVESM